METNYTSQTIANYVEDLRRGRIKINRDYQRSDEVWPDTARSFLIETVLLRYPIPKFSLRQLTDPKTLVAHSEVVDGQQRSRALQDFAEDNLRLTKTLTSEHLRGRLYSELEEADQERFLNYQIQIDLYLGTSDSEVREIFRRINSYTVPLNPEEQRHAIYQGLFKWFVHELMNRYDEPLATIGVFTKKQLVRMQHGKLLTELLHALEFGITTTKAPQLNALYKAHDKEFHNEKTMDSLVRAALDTLVSWSDIHGTALMRPYQVYALVLALIHVTHPQDTLNSAFEVAKGSKVVTKSVTPSLLRLGAILEDDGQHLQATGDASQYVEFIAASSSKTNTREQRSIRFAWYCRALRGEAI